MKKSVRFRSSKPASVTVRTSTFTSTAPSSSARALESDLAAREFHFLEEVRHFSGLASELKQDQRRVYAGKEALEDRMLGVLSFATSIELYRRFLDERESYAHTKLAQPLNENDVFEKYVDGEEKSAEKCRELVEPDMNDELERINFEEQLALDTLLSKNTAKSLALQLRRALLNEPSTVSIQKPLELAKRTMTSAFSAESQIEFAKLEQKKANELFEKTAQRQKMIDEIHRKLEQYESEYNNRIRQNKERYQLKIKRLQALRNNMFEVEKNLMEIHRLSEENAKLKVRLLRQLDNDAAVRREHSGCIRLQDKIDSDKNELAAMKNRYEDRRNYAKKRRHAYKKRQKEVQVVQEDVDKAEKDCQERIQQVLDIEKQEREMEVKLNNKLKEMQNILVENNEEPSFESSCTPVSQVGELQKIITLVSNNENSILN